MVSKLEYDVITDPRTQHQLVLINNTSQVMSLQKISFSTNVDIQNPWGPLSSNWGLVKKTRSNDNLFYNYELTLNQPLQLQPGKNSVLIYAPDNILGSLNVGVPPTNVAALINNELFNQISIASNGMSQNNPHPNFVLKNYHADWGQYAEKKTADAEPYDDINSINYAFIGFNEQGDVFVLDAWGDSLELPKLTLARQRTGYLNLGLSFGGWTNAGKRMDTVFAAMAKNLQAREKFVKAAVDAVVITGANGIDLDWEYPAAEDADNFVNLLKELRNELDSRKLTKARLTIAAPAGKKNIEVFSKQQWQEIARQVDDISIMTYDYFGAFSKFSAFHSPMNLSSNSPYFNDEEGRYFCVTKTLEIYTSMGIDPKKLVLGIPNYCRGVIVNELGPYQGLYQLVQGAPMGEFGQEGGIYSWNEILKKLRHQPSELDKLNATNWQFYDSQHPLCQEAGMCLLIGKLPDNRYAVFNFLDPNCAYRRGLYARNFGGGMVWANNTEADKYEDSIMNAISHGLENKPYQFTNQISLKTQQEHAKHFSSQSKTKLIGKISDQIKNLENSQKRNSVIFQILKFFSNFIPGQFIAAKPLIVEASRRVLNVDIEQKNIDKITALKNLLTVHTNHEAEEIIEKNIKVLNQHRGTVKRILTAILPNTFVLKTKWLQTESYKLAKKFQATLPIILDSATVVNMGEIKPPDYPPPENLLSTYSQWARSSLYSHATSIDIEPGRDIETTPRKQEISIDSSMQHSSRESPQIVIENQLRR